VDSFVAAFDSWKLRDSEVTADLSDLFDDSQYFYFRDLMTQIQNTELDPNEKDFLEMFLGYILNQGEGRFMHAHRLNYLAEIHLSKYLHSPFRRFVQSYIQTEPPPPLWTFGFSLLAVDVAFPFGDFSNGVDWDESFGMLKLDLSVGYRVKLFHKFAVVPHGGLGILKTMEG
jgi:hypothetical protein